MKRLSKRAATEYSTEFQPNYYNEENAKNYNYLTWLDIAHEKDQKDPQPYEILNFLNQSDELSKDLQDFREKNRTWNLLPQK